jgi:hypothetical protein
VEDAPPRWARPFAYSFLALFLTCAVANWEAWPLSGWKLFSYARGEVTSGWQVTTVDDRGVERPVDWGALPRAYRGWAHVLPSLARGTDADRAGACRAWATAVSDDSGRRVTAVRAYRTRSRVPTSPTDDRALTRQLVFACPSP